MKNSCPEMYSTKSKRVRKSRAGAGHKCPRQLKQRLSFPFQHGDTLLGQRRCWRGTRAHLLGSTLFWFLQRFRPCLAEWICGAKKDSAVRICRRSSRLMIAVLSLWSMTVILDFCSLSIFFTVYRLQNILDDFHECSPFPCRMDAFNATDFSKSAGILQSWSPAQRTPQQQPAFGGFPGVTCVDVGGDGQRRARQHVLLTRLGRNKVTDRVAVEAKLRGQPGLAGAQETWPHTLKHTCTHTHS